MSEIILPNYFIISRHAAQRFLERIIQKDDYTEGDEDVAILLIQNILSNIWFTRKPIWKGWFNAN